MKSIRLAAVAYVIAALGLFGISHLSGQQTGKKAAPAAKTAAAPIAKGTAKPAE